MFPAFLFNVFSKAFRFAVFQLYKASYLIVANSCLMLNLYFLYEFTLIGKNAKEINSGRKIFHIHCHDIRIIRSSVLCYLNTTAQIDDRYRLYVKISIAGGKMYDIVAGCGINQK